MEATTKVEIDGQSIDASVGQTLFDCADVAEVPVPTSCNRNGKCRECVLEVISGESSLSLRSPEEQLLRPRYRLACCTTIAEREGVVRCATLRRGGMRIVSDAEDLSHLAPTVSLAPAVTRDGEWVLLDGERLTQAGGKLHGLAIDVGTTTVVVRLVDLETGKICEVRSFENPQRFAGSDVLARIAFDTQHGGRLLQRTLLDHLGQAILTLNCDPQSIYEVLVVGNTTMRDLLFGLEVYSVGQRPYRSITEHALRDGERDTTSLSTTAKKLRLPIFSGARIQSLPLISGHIGADTAACLLAIDIAREDSLVAMMDIGTNTELVVGNRHRLLAASCPAGPAFEGGSIACGMPGLEGAVESVELSHDESVRLSIIGGGDAKGICGSGLIKLVSELLRTDRMDSLGRFVDHESQYMLDREAGVFLSENDISELAQAKGANVAGLRIVLNAYGIDFSKIDRFYVAGGFGRHLDLAAAKRIGLIPDLPSDKILQIGNASIEGATRALCSTTIRAELEALVRTITHVELETDPQFFDHFVEGCQFNRFTSTSASLAV
jgi:uncharacterized 2Fe-2S/4Fe-4S cluster protein (DUF4445 family)